MNILDLISTNTALLTEANILNVKDPHDGHSIQKYLKHYAKSIKTDPAKKMFIKKLQKLLLNDPKYHYAVRELPDDAPEWAHEALAKKDLFFFKPNPELNNTIEHMTHYIAKMEEDMEQTQDNDKKVRATKEFAAFPKAENLEMLEKKSDEYFARGAKDSADLEGMKEIYKKDGFTWYKLESAAAFKRAGDTLQNCIGSHWTKAKCDNLGESIVILVDKKGNFIVAARIGNKKNELHEMKGKNNKPPIKAYMPPVAALINKFKLSLDSMAHSDVINTGYYFDEDSRTLLTKPQAIKKLVEYDTLGSIGFGLTLVKPRPKGSSEAAQSLFNELYTGSRWGYGMHNKDIYEARQANGNPVIVAVIEDKKVEKLQTYFSERLHDESHLHEAVNEAKKKEYFKAFVNRLVEDGKIKGFDNDILRHVFWEVGLEWDQQAKELRDRAEGAETTTDKKHHGWKKYTDRSTVDTIRQTLELRHPNKIPRINKVYVATEEIADDRSRNDEDVHIAVLVNDKNKSYLTNISGKAIGEDDIGYKKEVNHSHWNSNFSRQGVDTKTIKSLVALAKQEGFELPAPALARFGVLGEKPEKYERFEPNWQKISGEPEAIKADFSHLRDHDRFMATYSTAMTELGGLGSKDLFGLHKKMSGADEKSYYSDYGTHNINHGDQWTKSPKALHKLIGDVDTIFKVNVGYGTGNHHGVMLLVNGKKIVKVDKNTEDHTWQGWDDFDNVSDALNKFAEAHNLTFEPDAVTTDKRASTEFRVLQGKLTTAQKVKADELSRKKKKEGTDEIKFANDWVLERMTPEEQGKWIRRGVRDGVRGQAWLLKDDKDNKHAVFTILHQRVARMFYNHGEATKEWPTSYGMKMNKYLPYLKTAMKEFKWKPAKTGTMKDQRLPYTTVESLKKFKGYDEGSDNYVRQNDDKNLSKWQMDPMVDKGLLSTTRVNNRRAWQMTPEGKAMLKRIEEFEREGKELTDMDLVNEKGTHPDWSMPEPAARRPAARRQAGAGGQRRQAAAGGESKAAQALTKFQDHVEEHGEIPTRSEFIAYMEEDPFNMSKSGAQTYYYSTKKKYAALNESILGDVAKLLLIEPDFEFDSFADLVFD